MKKLIFSLLIIMAFSLTTLTYAQQPAQPQPTPQERAQKLPDLPDFTKEPFELVLKADDKFTPVLHRDWGKTPGELYKSTDNTSKEANFVLLFLNKDGSKRYAEWLTIQLIDKDVQGEIYRGYLYIDGKFVFENEKKFVTINKDTPSEAPTPKSP